jgi:hypothetical protein
LLSPDPESNGDLLIMHRTQLRATGAHLVHRVCACRVVASTNVQRLIFRFLTKAISEVKYGKTRERRCVQLGLMPVKTPLIPEHGSGKQAQEFRTKRRTEERKGSVFQLSCQKQTKLKSKNKKSRKKNGNIIQQSPDPESNRGLPDYAARRRV